MVDTPASIADDNVKAAGEKRFRNCTATTTMRGKRTALKSDHECKE